MDMQRATDALGRQWTPADNSKRFARQKLQQAREARLAGDTRTAHYALQEATSSRGSAQDALGIKPSPRVFQRPNAWAHGDLKATRRLP